MRHLIVGSRKSKLALAQTEEVANAMERAWPDLVVSVRKFTTTGDRVLDRPLPQIGDKGLFTAELEWALLDGEIDFAVHSLKDIPTELPPGLDLGAIPKRQDVRDVVVSRLGLGLMELPPGATVGTSSLRREMQVTLLRPDLRIEPIRGNVDTRVRKAMDPEGPYDAVIMAAAGLIRLGLTHYVDEWLDPTTFLPAPGQGALALEMREDDRDLLSLMQALRHRPSEATTAAERAFQMGLGSNCRVPIAAYAWLKGGRIYMKGMIASPDASQVIRVEGDADVRDADGLGWGLAERARRLGAEEILLESANERMERTGEWVNR